MSQTPTDDMVEAARFTLSGICGFEVTAQAVRKALESALAVAPAPAEHVVGVEAAWHRYTHGGKPSIWGREVFEAGFRAARAPAPAELVMGVKPLEWTKAALQHSYGLVIRIGQTPFGAYHILKGRQGKFEVYFTTVPLSGAIDDEAEALAWAQSDYERRIRAALSSPMGSGE